MTINFNNDKNYKKNNIQKGQFSSEQSTNEINLFGQDNYGSKSNDVPTIFAPKDNKKTTSASNSVVGELEKQSKKYENALNEPIFKMSEAEKKQAKKLNEEQAKRDKYSKQNDSREQAIKTYAKSIAYYKIDVTGMTAEQIEQAVNDAYKKAPAPRKENEIDIQKRQKAEKARQAEQARRAENARPANSAKPTKSQNNADRKGPSKIDERSYNYKTLPRQIENKCMFDPKEYDFIERKRDKYDLSNKAPDEKDRTNKDFQYKSNRSSYRTQEVDKAYRKRHEFYAEDEIDRRAYSHDEAAIMVETYGGFRETNVFGGEHGYHGKVGTNSFKMYKRENQFDPGNQYLGRIGRFDVDIEERDIDFSFDGLHHYFGKIGDHEIKMESKVKEFSPTDRVIYEGKYKGRSFQVEVGGDNVIADDGDRVIRGYYGGERVDIKKTHATLTDNDRLKIKQLPKDFEDVASFIFVAHTELEKESLYESDEY